MSDRKKQHFVPQFYLRHFSVKVADRMVSLFHMPSGQFVPTAPIKSKACEDNFYRELQIEAALGDLEGAAARIISEAIRSGALPKRFSADHHVLLLFVLFQSVRTPAAAEEMTEAMTKMWRILAAKGVPQLAEHAWEIQVRLDNPAGLLLKMAAMSYPLALDLRWKLLRNRTRLPFITSDHPAVLYNQLFEHHGDGSNTGVVSKGLQIFLPLSPGHLLVLFDSDVYRVGGKKLKATNVDVAHVPDADALNLLQAVNADETLYFNDDTDEKYVRSMTRSAVSYRRPEKSVVKEHLGIDALTGVTGALFQLSRIDVRTGLRLRCIKVLPSAAAKPPDGRMVQARDPSLLALYEEFFAEARAKGYGATHFGKWLRTRFGEAEPR